nr:hypothetical protein [Tanacetum cinerariifolium]
MSRDVLTVGSTMRIPLLYRGEYSQWVERFMNYLEEQTDGEAMINLIKNGDQPLPRVTQVSIPGTLSTEQPPLKDKSMWSDQEKRIQKIDRLARSLLIQGLPNDIYSLIDSNKTGKDLWDALARHMLGELLLDIYIRCLQVVNDLKKCGYSKDNCELNFKFLNNLQPEWKQYATMMRQNKNLMDINIDALYNILKRNQRDVNDAMGSKKKTVVSANKKQEFVKNDNKTNEKKDDEKKQDMSRVKCYNCKKEGHFTKDCKKVKKVLSDSETSSSSADEKISETVHMIMPSIDNLYNGRKGIGFKNPSYFEKTKDLRPTLYDEKVIGLVYTPMFLTHSDEALEIEKFKRARENKIEFANDYRSLNASYVNEKIIFSDDYFQEIINLDFEKIDSPFQQTSSLKPYVPTVILEKIIIDLEDKVLSLLEKEKANMETIKSLKSKGFELSENAISETENQSENDCHMVEKKCDKVENPKVIAHGMFKLSVSQSVSPISIHSKANKDVKQYSRKDLLSCNNSYLGETSSAYVCNDAMNVSCNSMMYDLFDDNNLFIFDDESVRISPVSKMPFRKKPHDSLNERSKSNSDKSLPRTMHRWLPKLQPLAKPVAKWIPRVEHCPDLSLDLRFGMFKAYDRKSCSVDKLCGKVYWNGLVWQQ